MPADPPRPRARRRADALEKLRTEVDLWVASAGADGKAHLIPLSFYWDGEAVVIATPRESRTARNLVRAGRARVALGPTRDVLILEGPVEEQPRGTRPDVEDAHTRATGFDAREEPEDYAYLRITPRTILAWRESNELPERLLMRRGEWIA